MVEQRCPCGFLRSKVKCPTCDGGLSPNAKPREHASASRPASRPARRGTAVPHGLVGEYECSSCHRTKPLSEFYISRAHPSGHQSRCKACDNNKRVQRLQRARSYV
jgi:hypothetical protein